MARKPAHVLAAAPRPQGRDAIWSAIRTCRKFTVLDLEHHCRANVGTIKTYLEGLTNAGYLRITRQRSRDALGHWTEGMWELIRDVGVVAPRVTRAGAPVTQGNARQQMWVAMRATKTFTHPELAYIASTEHCVIDIEDCKKYVQMLARAGYLVLVERGRPQHPAVYRFTRNTGPKSPQIQKVQQVWDPNLKQVMWSAGGDT
jgi:hypothetical protein